MHEIDGIVTGVKTEFRKPRLLSGGDYSKDTSLITSHKRHHASDDIRNLMHISTHGLAHRHILSVDMFSKEQLNEIFNLAQTLRVYVIKGRPLDHILKVGVQLFYFIGFCQ